MLGKDLWATPAEVPLNGRTYNDSPNYTEKNNANIFLGHMNFGNIRDNYRGDGVKVAVIDSGVNYDHEDFYNTNGDCVISDLSASILLNSSQTSIVTKKVSQYGLSILDDTNGHGTNVASTIASQINGKGSLGVAPNVELVILKTNYNFAEIATALNYCITNKIDIVNMSIQSYVNDVTYNGTTYKGSGSTVSTYLDDYTTACYNAGIAVFAAGGNYGTTEPSYPANSPHVLAVGALARDSSTTIASYSNRGTNVDVVGPGSVYVADITGNTSYKETQGTSFACPAVVGAAALYKQLKPTATPSQIYSEMENTCHDLGDRGFDSTFGYGRVDVSALVNPPVFIQTITPNPTSINVAPGKTAKISCTISPSDATNKEIVFISEDESIATVDDNGVVTGIKEGNTSIYIGADDDGGAEVEVPVTVAELTGEPKTVSKEWSLTSASSDWVASGNETYFSQPYGFKKANGTLTTQNSIDDFNHDSLTKIKVGFKCLQNGGSSSRITIYLYNDEGTVLGSEVVTPPNATAATNTSYVYATFENNLAGAAKFGMKVTTYGKNILINGASYEVTYLESGSTPTTPTVTSVTITGANSGDSLEVGNTLQLGASVTGANSPAQTVTWSSSNNAYATVSTSGLVTAKAKGTVTITATSTVDTSKKDTISLNITKTESSGYTGTYYNSITATSGTNLLGQLHTLMANTHYKYTTYDDCKNPAYIYKTDPGTSSSYVTDFYTQKDNQVEWGSGSTGTWNREHVWCQSLSVSASTGTQLWGETYGGSDLQHVRPVESTLNSKRNNNPYGVLSDFGYNRNEELAYAKNKNSVKTDLGGYVVSKSDTFAGVFEPLDTAKGDVARILMYVYMHYSNQTSGTDADTKLNGHTTDLSIKKIVNTSANTDKAAWNLLLSWSESDPVSEMEQIRNEEAFKIQGNRNPFIDHPEYAKAIWGSSTPTPTKTLSSISLSNKKTEYSVGDTFEKPTVTANYSDGTHTIVTDSAIFTGYNIDEAGEQTVSVSYTEGEVTKSVSYTITVSAAAPVGDQPITLTFALKANPGGWPTANSTTLTNYTYTLDGVDYSFGLKNTKSNSGYLMMTEPAVLGLPAIDGYKLTKVVASNTGGCFTSVNVGISSSASSENYISGGEKIVWETQGSSYTYNLTGTADNTVYYLYITVKNAQVTGLDLTYEPVSGGGVTPTPSPKVNSISLDETSVNLDLNGTKTKNLIATVDADQGADATVTWSSSDESVATVSNGLVTAVGVGTATITAQAGEKTATCTVNVSDSSPVVTGITLSNTSLTLNVGDDETLTATINGTNIPSDAKVSWSSDKTNIATVDQNGKVTGVAAGTAVITASYGGKDASCTVTVNAAEPGPTPTGEYALLTDASVLKAGYQIVIANSTNKVTAGEIPNSKAYMDQVTSAFSSDGSKITTLGEGTVEFTLSGDASGWTLSNESNALGSAAAKSVSWNTGTTTWTISVDSKTNNATIANTTSTYGKILYNLGSSRFASYTSSPNNQMLMPQIYYKSSGSTPEPEKNIVSATLTPNVSTVKYMENNGSLDVSATLVVKYEDGETKTVEPTSKNYTIDTTSLGKQQISATFKGVTYYGYVSVSSQGYSAGSSSKDSFSVSNTNIKSGAGYKPFEMTDKSNATYVGIACNTGALQIKSGDSNTGVVQTVSGGKVKSITFDFSNIGNGIQIYGKNTNYSEAANLFDNSLKGTLLATVTSSNITYASNASTAEFIEQGDTAASTIKTVDISSLGDYEYIGFRSISGAVALNSFEVNVERDGTSEYEALARAWSNYFMSTTSPICGANQSGDNSAELSAVWTDLTNEFNNMNSKAQSLFLTSNDEVIVGARERYTHIVSHYGTNLTANFAGAQIASRNTINFINDLQVFTSDHPESYITLILSLVGAFSLGGYFVVKKRKEN